MRAPKQDRTRATVEAILESAVQILEADGLAGFKVAALAERSGYGVGTRYQYFESIDAFMLALVELENERARQKLLAEFSDRAASGQPQGTRELANLMLSAFSQRRAAQKTIVEWTLSRRDMRAFDSRNTFLGALRTAIWNDEADTSSPQFAQALTDLVDGYVHQLVRCETMSAASR